VGELGRLILESTRDESSVDEDEPRTEVQRFVKRVIHALWPSSKRRRR